MKRRVAELISKKGLGNFPSLKPSQSVMEALITLKATKRSALLLIDEDELRGIFSEKDFVNASLTRRVGLSDRVSSIMTRKVYFVDPQFTLEECIHIMSKVHVRHLPVLEGRKVIGLVGMREIMETLVEDKDFQIRELTNYISGPGSVLYLDKAKADITRPPVLYTHTHQEAL